MRVQKAAFWLTVAGVSVLAPFTLQLMADNLPLPGLKRLVGYLYKQESA
jgi:hypothetical protein